MVVPDRGSGVGRLENMFSMMFSTRNSLSLEAKEWLWNNLTKVMSEEEVDTSGFSQTAAS